MKSKMIGQWLLVGIGLLMILILLGVGPVIQDAGYHKFADSRSVFRIPSFWNVISNIPFLVVGVMGVLGAIENGNKNFQYAVLFVSVFLTGLGSAYYHSFPTSETLVWDRLPMTLVFMSLFSILISQYISDGYGKLILPVLILFGVISIIFWVFGQEHDLRLYALVQFYPMLAIPIILVFFGANNPYNKTYWLVLLCYGTAKFLEYYDIWIYQQLKVVSGHSLKHMVAAIGLFILYMSLFKKRKKKYLYNKAIIHRA